MSAAHTPGRAGFDAAVVAITRGNAKPRSLWLLLCDESEREGYALKPQPWEGSGEYQCVEYANGRTALVRLPSDAPCALPRAALTAAGVTP